MKAKLARWGNSMGMRLPKSVVDELRLTLGSQLDLVVDGGEIRLRPLRDGPRQLLADMVEQARNLGAENEPETIDWGADRGSEVVGDDDPR